MLTVNEVSLGGQVDFNLLVIIKNSFGDAFLFTFLKCPTISILIGTLFELRSFEASFEIEIAGD